MMSKGEETPEQKRKRQTDAIHAALGRYVEAFEQLLLWIRGGCVMVTSATATPPGNVMQQRLMNVVFHHRSMTAEPLFNIYRGLVGEIINAPDVKIEPGERSAIESILKQF